MLVNKLHASTKMLKNKRDWTSWLRTAQGIMWREASMAMSVADLSPLLVDLTPLPPMEHPRQYWSTFRNDCELPP